MSNQHPRRRRRLVALLTVGAVAGSVGAGGSVAANGESTAQANDGQYIAQYADAVFVKRGTELQLAPGVIDDQGSVTEVLEASVYQESCQGRFLVTIDVSAAAEADDIPGVEVDARGGHASVYGTFTLTGEVTITPAGRNCVSPLASAATVAPLSTDVFVDAIWSNQRGSVPVVYSGDDCGGDGICYTRDARANASWASDFIGEASARSTEAFFFEGTYNVGSAALARIPSL